MWTWIRIPKGLALISFVLPWMTVSCSNQKIAEASGFGLATGNITFLGQAADQANDGSLNFLLILALAAIIGGLVLLFIRGREAAKLVLGTSIAGLVLIFAGTNRYSLDAITAEAANSTAGGGMDQAALAMIQVNWEFGYWLAILSLIAAAVMAWLVISGKDSAVSARFTSAAPPATPATPPPVDPAPAKPDDTPEDPPRA